MNNLQAKWVSLTPKSSTAKHHHHEAELWYIVSGKGIVHKGADKLSVREGESIYFSPLEEHSMQNASAESSLHFISQWWTDWELLAKVKPFGTSPLEEQVSLLLPSFPTPNGNLHLGHLAGPYLAADVYKRYQELAGKKAYYLSGTIGHQTQVDCKSRQLGLGFYETAELYSNQILDTFRSAHIHPDTFTTAKEAKLYHELMLSFFHQLQNKGLLKFKMAPTLFCQACDKYLFESQAQGNCPHCDSTAASANECEACALVHTDETLKSACCSHCQQPATLKLMKRIFFPLEPFREPLYNHYSKLRLAPRIQQFIDQVFNKTLIDFPISHLSAHGVNIPLADYPGQRFYSLFELAARYATGLEQLSQEQQLQANWLTLCSQYKTKLFFGYDNAYLRLVIFPALLQAYDENIQLPDQFIVNEFYQLEGSKFSTSRNHAIWGIDLMNSYPADLVRFYLAYTRPETEQTDFKLAEFNHFIENELRKPLKTWLIRLGKNIHEHSNRVAPEAAHWGALSHEFFLKVKNLIERIQETYLDSAFSLQELSCLLLKLIQEAFHFSLKSELRESQAELDTQLALELMAARGLALLSYPLMPNFAEELWRKLGYKGKPSLSTHSPVLAWIAVKQDLSQLLQPYLSF